MKGFKTENEYQQLISRDLYEKTPKAVFAALAVSLFMNYSGIEMRPSAIDEAILQEWGALFSNEIVGQKPPKSKWIKSE